MRIKWLGAAVLACAFTICFAGTAQADVTMNAPGTDTEPTTTVAADGGYTVETDTLTQDAVDPSFSTDWHCRTIHTQRSRYGVFGGLLWRFQRDRHWCYNNIRIKNVSTSYSNSRGSGTWEYDGLISNNYNVSGCPTTSCWYYGSTTKALMTSLIPIPFTTITEHNKPWIRQTIFSDGHATATTNCGC